MFSWLTKTKDKTPALPQLQQRIEFLKQQLDNVPRHFERIHTVARALRTIIAKLRAQFIFSAQHADGPMFHPGNASIMPIIRAAELKELTDANALLGMIEASDEYKQASSVCDPLLAQLAVAEEEYEQARAIWHERRRELKEAEQKAVEHARQTALSAVRDNPDFAAARANLAALAGES